MTPNFLKCRATNCTRAIGKFGDLVCPAHWRMVPADLRRALIAAQTERQSKRKRDSVLLMAATIVSFLDSRLIQLPPE